MAKHNELGALGEDIACKFLENKGFSIIVRNYRKPWGELDIVAERNGLLHFVEVKSVTWKRVSHETQSGDVSHETRFQPEDAVHPRKVQRLRRVIRSYLLDVERDHGDPTQEIRWVFDIAAVFVDQKDRTARVRFRENVVL